jgi:hypothetical protein
MSELKGTGFHFVYLWRRGGKYDSERRECLDRGCRWCRDGYPRFAERARVQRRVEADGIVIEGPEA